jgi:hypothetical protein
MSDVSVKRFHPDQLIVICCGLACIYSACCTKRPPQPFSVQLKPTGQSYQTERSACCLAGYTWATTGFHQYCGLKKDLARL